MAVKRVTTKSIAATTKDEVLATQTWADNWLSRYGRIKKLGVYGDKTSGTYYELWLGDQKGPEGVLHHTAYDEDHIDKYDDPIVFWGSVRMYIYNAAGTSQAYEVVIDIE